MEMQVPTVGSIWKNHTFFRSYIAYSLSIFGDWFDMTAMIVLFAYKWQADPLVISLIPLTFAVPGIVLGQWAGVIADRAKKLNIMMGTDLARAVLTTVLLFTPNPYWAVLVLLLRSAFGVFNMPAQQSLTRSIVADEHLLKASAVNGLMNQMTKVLGPLIGGTLLTFLSPMYCIAINAVSFLLSALVLFTIRKVPENQSRSELGEERPHTTFRESIREGWAVILKKRMILNGLIYGMIGGMGLQLVDFQFAVPFAHYAPSKPNYFAWNCSAIAIGSVCIIVWLNRKTNIEKYGLYNGIGTVLLSLVFICIGWLEPGMPLYVPLLVTFISGIGNGINAVVPNYMFQKEIPQDMIGRFYGIQNSIFSAVMLVMPLLGGLLIDLFGATNTFRYIGYFLVFWGIVALLFRNVIWKRESVHVPEAVAASSHDVVL